MTEHDGEGLLQEVARRCGDDAALRLADRFGGLKIYIPAAPDPAHRLAAALGREVLEALVAIAGGSSTIVPRGHRLLVEMRRRMILELYRSGVSTGAIGRRIGVTQRYVQMVLRDERSASTLSRHRASVG